MQRDSQLNSDFKIRSFHHTEIQYSVIIMSAPSPLSDLYPEFFEKEKDRAHLTRVTFCRELDQPALMSYHANADPVEIRYREETVMMPVLVRYNVVFDKSVEAGFKAFMAGREQFREWLSNHP